MERKHARCPSRQENQPARQSARIETGAMAEGVVARRRSSAASMGPVASHSSARTAAQAQAHQTSDHRLWLQQWALQERGWRCTCIAAGSLPAPSQPATHLGGGWVANAAAGGSEDCVGIETDVYVVLFHHISVLNTKKQQSLLGRTWDGPLQ